MGEHQKWIRGVRRAAQKQGFRVTITKHFKFRSPSGATVCVSGSPSNPKRARPKILKDLRGIGLVI